MNDKRHNMKRGKLCFKVVEKPYEPIFDDIRKILKETGKINISEVYEKYNPEYSRRAVSKKIGSVCEELGLDKDEVTGNHLIHPKYYFRNKYGSWTVQRTFIKKGLCNTIYYGNYSTEKDAKQVVEKLKECQWDKKLIPYIKREIGI